MYRNEPFLTVLFDFLSSLKSVHATSRPTRALNRSIEPSSELQALTMALAGCWCCSLQPAAHWWCDDDDNISVVYSLFLEPRVLGTKESMSRYQKNWVRVTGRCWGSNIWVGSVIWGSPHSPIDPVSGPKHCKPEGPAEQPSLPVLHL